MKKTLVPLPLLISSIAPLFCAEKEQIPQQKWDGQYYNSNNRLQFQSAMQFLPALSIKPNEKILDVGCGPGNITVEIAKQVPYGSVVGIDISQSMVETAQQNYGAIDNLSFKLCDARDLNFNNDFDRIVSFLTLHWIQDQQAVLSSCYNNLKPGGLINIFMVPHVEDHPFAYSFDQIAASKRWKDTLGEVKANDQYYGLTEQSIKSLMEQAGFTVLDIHSLIFENTFDSVDAIKKHISGWIVGFSAVSSLPETAREEFVNDLTNRYAQVVGTNADGSYAYNRHF